MYLKSLGSLGLCGLSVIGHQNLKPGFTSVTGGCQAGLERRGIDTWIRHVIVPGYTDNDEWLEALARYVSSYKVVRKVELLPYHTMGTYKYEQLGLDYPLKGVEPLSKERLDNAKAIFSRYKPENNKA